MARNILTRSRFVGDGKTLYSDETNFEVGVASLKVAFKQIEELSVTKKPEEVCEFLRAAFGNWLIESMKYRGAYKSVVVVDRFQLHIIDGLPGAGKSHQCARLFNKLVDDHIESRKPATMFSQVSEVYEVYAEVGFFDKVVLRDAYLMCYELALVIDSFKRIHACMATSVGMEEKGFQPTFKHVILVDGGPQRANAFFAWQEGKDIHAIDTLCHLWSELFRNTTKCYLFVCPWKTRVTQLERRSKAYPYRVWENDSWGVDKMQMTSLERSMARNLGKLCLQGTDGVYRVNAVMSKESTMLEQVFEDVLREAVEPWTSEVGWWRVAVQMGNDPRARRECEMFLFNKSWPSVPFAHRLQIIQGAFHSRFSVGGSSVVPDGDEHVSISLVRLIAMATGLTEDDLNFEHIDRNLSLFAATGYCGSWVEFMNKEVRETLSLLSSNPDCVHL